VIRVFWNLPEKSVCRVIVHDFSDYVGELLFDKEVYVDQCQLLMYAHGERPFLVILVCSEAVP
jgi:hypothetical protein